MAKAALRLDKHRDHGEVHPPEAGAHFYQDGLYFDAKGDVIENDDLQGPDGSRRIQQAVKQRRAKEAADKAYAEEMAKQDAEVHAEMTKIDAKDAGKAPEGTQTEQERTSTTQGLGGGDKHTSDAQALSSGGTGDSPPLTASEKKTAATKGIIGALTGERKLPFHQVKKLFEDAFAVKVMDLKNAKDIAIEKGILTADRIKV